MTNHFHLMLTPGSAVALPRTMKEVAYLALGADQPQRQEAYRALCAISVSNTEIVRLQDPRVGLGSDPDLTLIRSQSDPSLTP